MTYQSAVDRVASIDGLLTEIFLRLPVRPLLRFKSVSKHWYLIISSPGFKLLCSSRNPDPPFGLFVPVKTKNPYLELEYEFAPFDIKNPVKPPFKIPGFDPNGQRIYIEDSCNGLMLCSCFDNLSKEYKCCYIYNPTINQFTTIPRFDNYDNVLSRGMILAFDPSKSPHYKIIYVNMNSLFDLDVYVNEITQETIDMESQIRIYSSQTRTCKPSCIFPLACHIKMDFRDGVYWNNAIHWIDRFGLFLYIDLDKEIAHQMQTPFHHIVPFDDYSNYIFESRDHLLLVEMYIPVIRTEVKIHELKRDYSEWFVKYHVNLMEIGGSFYATMNRISFNLDFFGRLKVVSLVLSEKEEDSFLVLQTCGEVVRFNLVSKIFHKLLDFTHMPYNMFPQLSTRQALQFRPSLHSV